MARYGYLARVTKRDPDARVRCPPYREPSESDDCAHDRTYPGKRLMIAS